MKTEKTNRGFEIIKFRDYNDEHCSLQQSSLATEEAIWLGVDKPVPQILTSGEWKKVPLPIGTILNGRMHLTREQVEKLLPHLKRFVKNGTLK